MTQHKTSSTLTDKLWASGWTLFLGLLFYLGTTLIFFGSGLGSSYLVQLNTKTVNTNLSAKKVEQNKRRPTTYDASKTATISTRQLLQSRQVKAYGIGRLAIPAVNIHTPLLAGYGTNNQNLAYGVVTCLPDRILGGANNYVLAGHYMGSYGAAVLDNLHFAKPGDIVYVTDLHHIYAYRLQHISFAIKPTQVEVENNLHRRHLLTLITCSDFNTSKYGYGAHRTVAQGKLIGQMKANQANLAATELTTSKKQYNNKKLTFTTKNGFYHTTTQTKRIVNRFPTKFYQEANGLTIIIIIFTVSLLLVVLWSLIKIWLR